MREDAMRNSPAFGAVLALLLTLACAPGAMAAETEHTGEMYAFKVPGRGDAEKLSLAEAKEIVATYRWIYVNASLKDLAEAKHEARALSNAVGRPVVLLYLSRFIFDQQRNDYPRQFSNPLKALIEAALAEREGLLISAKSFGTHQTLRVLRQYDDPSILLTGISPAFGAFGNAYSDNVKRYIRDVRDTRSRYCMIASEQDGFTWRSGGAARRRGNGTCRGDNDVCDAMDRNKDNVKTYTITGSDHSPIDDYINHGLVGRMKDCARHFHMAAGPVGDVVYNRPLPDPGAQFAWLVPVMSMINQ